jgi:UDP-2,4-diacetamido-2,4,6-trideoxy-beta-L-altropyranose hydrolase
MKALLLRADAHVTTGTGHVMRSLALGQAWQDRGGKAFIACRHLPATLKERMEGERIPVFLNESVEAGSADDAAWTRRIAEEIKAGWIAVDGYAFDYSYLQAISGHGFKVLAFDDYGHFGNYQADMILNSNVTAGEDLYRNRNPDCALLLGPRFAPLRREFLAARAECKSLGSREPSLLVTMGGSDPDNVTGRILEALTTLPERPRDICVVAGGSNPHFEKLQAAVQTLGPACRLLRNVQNMPELMASSDLAIAAGGSTYLEALYLRLACLLFILADNQSAIAHEMDRRGAARLAGDARSMDDAALRSALDGFLRDPGLHESLRRTGADLVDGCGAERVVEAMLLRDLRLRPATRDDAHLLWIWANDPAVRAMSFNNNPIPYDSHCRWLEARLAEPQTRMFIAESEDGAPWGQIRLESRGQETLLHLSVAPERRGSGTGTTMVERATAAAFDHPTTLRVIGLVRPENEASIKMFARCAFREESRSDAEVRMVRMRPTPS